MSTEPIMTGYPSIDRPWMKYYPQMMLDMMKHPHSPLYKYVESRCPGLDTVAISYYGSDVLWKTIFEERDALAASLRAMGYGEGDQIPCFFRMVPEFFPLFYAIEMIGASVLCRDNTVEENVEAVAKAQSTIMFTHSYISQEEMEAFLNGTAVKKIVVVDPLRSCEEKNLPPHVAANLKTYYSENPASGEALITWDDFLAIGKSYTGVVAAEEDEMRPIFRVYTSGSTGPSKQVLHCAKTMLDSITQTNLFGPLPDGSRATWMHTCLPPALIAAVMNMTIAPMTANQLLILDPYVHENDVDKSFVYFKPNGWPLIPLFLERLVRGGSVTPDFDMSFFRVGGIGAEAYNNTQIKRAIKFLKDHNSPNRLTVGYGSTEAGSAMTFPMLPTQFFNSDVGVPMAKLTVSIFKPGTQEELPYNQVGEICKTGSGTMLGYDNPEATAKALQTHADGKIWLHTGDIGYMEPNGTVHVLTRGTSPRYGGGDLMIQPMENLVADANIEGIDDQFFVNVPDPNHAGYFEPYFFAVLHDGYTMDDIRDQVNDALEPFQRPVKMIQVSERPFFHYKTNRIGITKEIIAERERKQKEAKSPAA